MQHAATFLQIVQ